MHAYFISQIAFNIGACAYRRVADLLVEKLRTPGYTQFRFAVAYMQQGGIESIAGALRDFIVQGGRVAGIVGVDDKGTSRVALETLMKLSTLSESTVFHASELTFHPKLFLLEGPMHAVAIVGSANLTASGLYTNVEAVAAVELDLSLAPDQAYYRSCDAFFTAFLDTANPNVKPITADWIQRLVKMELVNTDAEETEQAQRRRHVMAQSTPQVREAFPPITLLSRAAPSEVAEVRLGSVDSSYEHRLPQRGAKTPFEESRTTISSIPDRSPHDRKSIWPLLASTPKGGVANRSRLVFLDGVNDAGNTFDPQWWHLAEKYLRNTTYDELPVVDRQRLLEAAKGHRNCAYKNIRNERSFWGAELRRLNHTVRVAELLRDRFAQHQYAVTLLANRLASRMAGMAGPAAEDFTTDLISVYTNRPDQPIFLVRVRCLGATANDGLGPLVKESWLVDLGSAHVDVTPELAIPGIERRAEPASQLKSMLSPQPLGRRFKGDSLPVPGIPGLEIAVQELLDEATTVGGD